MPTAPSVPRRSPIQVLTGPNVAVADGPVVSGECLQADVSLLQIFLGFRVNCKLIVTRLVIVVAITETNRLCNFP